MATKTSKVVGVAAALKKSKRTKPAKKRGKSKGRGVAKRTSKATSKGAPRSGQSAPPIKLILEDLNAKETKVLDALNQGTSTREVWTIVGLALACFKSQGKKRGNSWVRNSLRRLVQAGLVEKTDRGQYRVSDAGRKHLVRAA